MNTFDERKRSYEAKFARDEELRFKATARRNRMLGFWAAEQLGMSGEEAEDYAKSVVRADFAEPGDADVVAKVVGDLKAKGVPADKGSVEAKMIELMSRAVAEIEAAKK
jgi:hypothetical protein